MSPAAGGLCEWPGGDKRVLGEHRQLDRRRHGRRQLDADRRRRHALFGRFRPRERVGFVASEQRRRSRTRWLLAHPASPPSV